MDLVDTFQKSALGYGGVYRCKLMRLIPDVERIDDDPSDGLLIALDEERKRRKEGARGQRAKRDQGMEGKGGGASPRGSRDCSQGTGS